MKKKFSKMAVLKIFLLFITPNIFSQTYPYWEELAFNSSGPLPFLNETHSVDGDSYSVDSNPLKTIYEYDACGNRIARKVIEINPSASKSNEPKMMGSDNIDTPYYVENIGEINVNVFPNPTSQKITIQINNYQDLQSGELYLYNMNGQLLNQLNIRHTSVEIDLSGMPSGTYLLKLYMNEYKNEWKIIKN